jgi:hypothetical protein
MLRHQFPVRALRGGALAVALALTSGAWMAAGSQAARTAAIVRVHQIGLQIPNAEAPRVLVWATGSARVGIGTDEPAPLTDTLRLNSLPAITADVSEADVHVRLLSPGRMRLEADVSGGRAIRFTATGRHVVLLKGGAGAETITDP